MKPLIPQPLTAISGKYDHETIHSLIDAVPVLHVSFTAAPNEDGIAFPTILPMIGCMSGREADDSSSPPVLYLHGYISSRIMKTEGLPVCVAATLLDGLVLALTPYNSSCNYRSAVVFGKAYLVADDDERLYAMERITNNIMPDRWANSRTPPTKAEMQSTGILRVEIESGSAKSRAGGPGEDRKDLKDLEMRERVWTGVIPTALQWGEPVAAEGNKVAKVPEQMEKWRKGVNAEGDAFAKKAAS